MDRKKFIGAATVAGLGVMAVGSATTEAATAPPANQLASNRNIQFMMQIIQAILDDLNADANDYGGNRGTAMVSLRAAKSQLEAALDYARAHGE